MPSRYVWKAWRHAGLISWAHGHGRSMSVALRPASVMARASLQQPAQAQTDPHKKMNTDNINNAGGLCSPSWIPLHAWRSGEFLSTDRRLTKQVVGPILTPLLALCTCYQGWRRYTKYTLFLLFKCFYFGACLDVFTAQKGVPLNSVSTYFRTWDIGKALVTEVKTHKPTDHRLFFYFHDIY